MSVVRRVYLTKAFSRTYVRYRRGPEQLGRYVGTVRTYCSETSSETRSLACSYVPYVRYNVRYNVRYVPRRYIQYSYVHTYGLHTTALVAKLVRKLAYCLLSYFSFTNFITYSNFKTRTWLLLPLAQLTRASYQSLQLTVAILLNIVFNSRIEIDNGAEYLVVSLCLLNSEDKTSVDVWRL